MKNDVDVTGVYHKNGNLLFNDITNIPIEFLDDLPDLFKEVYLVSAYIPSGKLSTVSREDLYKTNVELIDKITSKYYRSRIIYCSSVSVYKIKNSDITEKDNEGGLNEYGISKLWGEKIIEQLPDYAIVRFSSVYGIGMKLSTIIPNYIKEALSKKQITVWGSGERRQNYIHVSDAINFLIKAAGFQGNEKFLATSVDSITNFELATIIAKLTDSKILFQGGDNSPSFSYNNNFTKSALSIQSQISIENGIIELIKWLQEKF